jgi:hypothetical protein
VVDAAGDEVDVDAAVFEVVVVEAGSDSSPVHAPRINTRRHAATERFTVAMILLGNS